MPSSTKTKPKSKPRTKKAKAKNRTRSQAAKKSSHFAPGEVVRADDGVVLVVPPGKKTEPADPRFKVKKKGKKDKAPRKVYSAKTADRHELYQLSVQSPEEDAAFLARVYRTYRKKPALHFREDFCGTGLLMATWVNRGKQYTAEGFDIDPDPVTWGLKNNFAPIGKRAKNVTFHLKDVREPSLKKPDIRCAQNFSYFCFQERTTMLEYFRSVYKDLAKDGVFVLDIYGGPESLEELEEEREIEEGFTYVWDQYAYYPATGEYKTHIHFRFDDGSEIKRAFSYTWRLWSLLEIRDILLEAGFPLVDSYWEGTDENGEDGNGIFRKSKRGDNCLSWVTYLVAVK